MVATASARNGIKSKNNKLTGIETASSRQVRDSSLPRLAARGFTERSPKVLSALLDALAAEAAWGNTHRDEAAAMVRAANGLSLSVIQAVQTYAFVTSEYPFILSLENHCSIEQQKVCCSRPNLVSSSAKSDING